MAPNSSNTHVARLVVITTFSGFHNGTWMHGFGPFKNRTTGWMDEPGDEDPLVSRVCSESAVGTCSERF